MCVVILATANHPNPGHLWGSNQWGLNRITWNILTLQSETTDRDRGRGTAAREAQQQRRTQHHRQTQYHPGPQVKTRIHVRRRSALKKPTQAFYLQSGQLGHAVQTDCKYSEEGGEKPLIVVWNFPLVVFSDFQVAAATGAAPGRTPQTSGPTVGKRAASILEDRTAGVTEGPGAGKDIFSCSLLAAFFILDILTVYHLVTSSFVIIVE